MIQFHKSVAARCALALAAAVGFGATRTAMADEAPQPLLTQVLNDAGVGKLLDDAHVKIGGYAQGSWTYSMSDPKNPTIPGRGFDFENQDLTLNGIGLNFERTVDASKGAFDVGGKLALLYGGDARFTHSNGLFDDNQHGDTQYDITEAFVRLAVPVGRGLTLDIGKFITPIGYEYVDPTKNTLYSHGYLFNFAAPFSQTGIIGKLPISDQLTVMAGLTRGWDQSLEDNNGAIDFLGQVQYKPDSQWDTYFTLSVGPQQADAYGYRTELDVLIYYTLNEKWKFGGEALYAIEADVPGTSDDYSQWYGAAFYPSYSVCNYASINGRLEWFSDNDLVRGVGANNVYEATLGVTFMPMAGQKCVGSGLQIRPEIRIDYADDKAFDGGNSYSQTTFAVDAVLAF